jgi:hypothetical protein
MVLRSYSFGSVTGNDNVGGLVGFHDESSGSGCTIMQCVAFNPAIVGTVNKVRRILGNHIAVTDDLYMDDNFGYFNMTVNGSTITSAVEAGLNGADLAAMTDISVQPFIFWDFTDDNVDGDSVYWKIPAGENRPVLFVETNGIFAKLGEI